MEQMQQADDKDLIINILQQQRNSLMDQLAMVAAENHKLKSALGTPKDDDQRQQ